MSSVDRKVIAAEWAKRGFSCDLWTDAPGQRWEDFRHVTDEVVIVLEGEMEFEVSGKVHHPSIGEELVIPAGAVHSARNVGNTTAHWLYGYRANLTLLNAWRTMSSHRNRKVSPNKMRAFDPPNPSVFAGFLRDSRNKRGESIKRCQVFVIYVLRPKPPAAEVYPPCRMPPPTLRATL